MDVGATVRKARQGAGWTQRELARHTGVAQPTIARIEAGTADPRMSTVDRLLRACGVTLLSTPRPGAGVDEVRELVLDAWRMVVPKKVVAEYERLHP